MSRWWHGRLGAQREGAAAVEFAIIMIPLFLLLFGIVEFGIAYNRQQGIHAGTREAARVASIGASIAEIELAFNQTVDTVDGLDVEKRIYAVTLNDPEDPNDDVEVLGADPPCVAGVDRVKVDARIWDLGTLRSDYGISIPFFGQVDMSFPSTAVFVCEPRN